MVMNPRIFRIGALLLICGVGLFYYLNQSKFEKQNKAYDQVESENITNYETKKFFIGLIKWHMQECDDDNFGYVMPKPEKYQVLNMVNQNNGNEKLLWMRYLRNDKFGCAQVISKHSNTFFFSTFLKSNGNWMLLEKKISP